MKSGNKLAVALLSVALLITMVVTACAPAASHVAEQKILKLGCLMPFSGPAAMYGERGRQITDIYIDLINEDGGVIIGTDTYKVDLLWGDDQYSAAPAAAAARKLIYDDHVIAIIGYIGPGFSALSPVTNPEKVILICRTGSAIYSPAKDPYVIFGSPTGEVTLNQAIAAMKAHPDLHVLAWTGTMEDRRMTESVFKPVDDRLEQEFGIKSLRVYYPAGTTNFMPYLTKMQEQGAQVLEVGGTILEVALIAKQRWEMGYKWPIVHSSDNLVDILFSVAGKDAAQGIMGNRNNPLELRKVTVAKKYLDMTQRIMDRYQVKYGKPIDNYGVFSMAITHLSQYLECAQSIGTTDPDGMMKAFKGGTFDSFLGRYTFSGTKTYGAPVVFGYPCAMGEVQGDKEVYMGEYPLLDADMWYDYTIPVSANPAATAPPVSTTPAKPVASPATTSIAPGSQLSFKPAKYANDEYGFHVLYPDSMVQGKAVSKWSLFDAAEPATVPSIGVSVMDSENYDQAVEGVYKALGGTKISKVSEDPMTLSDGKTTAVFSKRIWEIGGYPIVTLSIAVVKGDKTISYSYSNISGMIDEKAGKEVLFTLTFTK